MTTAELCCGRCLPHVLGKVMEELSILVVVEEDKAIVEMLSKDEGEVILEATKIDWAGVECDKPFSAMRAVDVCIDCAVSKSGGWVSVVSEALYGEDISGKMEGEALESALSARVHVAAATRLADGGDKRALVTAGESPSATSFKDRYAQATRTI